MMACESCKCELTATDIRISERGVLCEVGKRTASFFIARHVNTFCQGCMYVCRDARESAVLVSIKA